MCLSLVILATKPQECLMPLACCLCIIFIALCSFSVLCTHCCVHYPPISYNPFVHLLDAPFQLTSLKLLPRASLRGLVQARLACFLAPKLCTPQLRFWTLSHFIAPSANLPRFARLCYTIPFLAYVPQSVCHFFAFIFCVCCSPRTTVSYPAQGYAYIWSRLSHFFLSSLL